MSKQLENYIQEEVQPAPLITDENFFQEPVEPKAKTIAPTPVPLQAQAQESSS